MKVNTLLFFAIICPSVALNAQKKQVEAKQPVRFEKEIGSQWTFNYFPSETADKGYESPGFNDSRWPVISIPHTWNTFETTGEVNPFAESPQGNGEEFWWTGWGWYRKRFRLNTDLTDRLVFLEFEGVSRQCRVWVNGKYIGEHTGGYGAFDFDITRPVRAGQDNVIAVAVRYLKKDEAGVQTLSSGPLNETCGITGRVTLSIKKRMYIPMQGAADHEGGTFITTPSVSGHEAGVTVRTWVKNEYPEARICVLQTSVTDGDGQVIQVMKSDASIGPGKLHMFVQTARPVQDPQLWSPDNPYLYSVYSEVLDKKEVSDNLTSTFGIRNVRTDIPARSVYINDRKTDLTGAARRMEYPWIGDAVPDWLTALDYSYLKEKGHSNFIKMVSVSRTGNSFILADREGLLIEQDLSAIPDQGLSVEEMQKEVRAVVRRYRNHPALIAWDPGIGKASEELANVILSEDSARFSGRLPAVTAAEPLLHDYTLRKNAARDSSDGRKPARIVLTGSHGECVAGRGTLIIIQADIADREGNILSGYDNNLNWTVTGPARIVGPRYYTSYTDSGKLSVEGYYTGMPAVNPVRSTGIPGKIVVTVFSPGVASGSWTVDATAAGPDMPQVTEPVLTDEGRKPVASNPLVTTRVEEVPKEIVPVTEDIDFRGADNHAYMNEVKKFIKKANLQADTSSVELNTLAGVLSCILRNNDGRISAQDFNFNAEHYNLTRLIAGYISRTKLPAVFRESLRKHYSALIIEQGSEKNAGDEMNWLNWIPSGGVVVIAADEKVARNLKGVIYTKETSLPEIIKVVYPQFAQFSKEGKERALTFISKMNPAVSVHKTSNVPLPGTEETGTDPVFTAEKGQPVLIPEYKFISE